MQHVSLRRLSCRAQVHGHLRSFSVANLGIRCGLSGSSSLHTASRPLSTSQTNSTAASPSATLSAANFSGIAPQLLLRQALQQYTALDGTQIGAELHPGENHILISREKFLQFCAQAHVDDPDATLAGLEGAGVVVVLDGGKLIHLRPLLYLATLELLTQPQNVTECGNTSGSATHGGTSATSRKGVVGSFTLEEAERRIAKLRQQEEEMAEQLQPAIARAAKWRRSVWGGALLFAGTQLAVISRLTYFDLDWDIMEPISYCLTIGTALVFYAYYLCYNEEHTYEVFDQRFLPKKVRHYAAEDFDWKAYESVCAQLVEERAMLERIRRWTESHGAHFP